MSATEKSIALVTDAAGHAMDVRCPCCIGGWWGDESGELTYAVHDAECPNKDASEAEAMATCRGGNSG